MRSEVTADVLEKVAKRLGRDYAAKKDLEGRPVILVRGNPAWRECSDGDLLLAILNKAAEMGYMPSLSKNPQTDRLPWDCEMGGYAGKQAVLGQGDPLTAAMLAFAQLPESP